MATDRAEPPAGRYGHAGRDDGRSGRRLKIVGAVLGAALLGFVGWTGWSYVTGQEVSGQLTGFTVVSDTEVTANIAVRKPAGTVGVCTVRSQAEDGLEVGRADFRFEEDADSVHRSVTLKTTERATSAELIGCTGAADAR